MTIAMSTYEKKRALEALLTADQIVVPDDLVMPLANDADAEVRWLAAELLVRRRDAAALALVLRLLQSARKESEKLRGLNLLDKLGQASAAPVIINYLKDGHARVRRSAALTLATMGAAALQYLENK